MEVDILISPVHRLSEKGVEFKEGGLHFGGFDGFGGSGKHLALRYRTKRQP